MGPTERLFKKEYAFELFRIARADLRTAQVLSQHSDVRKETVLLHCQQCVEKTLKSILCFRERPVPFTHEIVLLVERLKDDPPPESFALQDLTPYASLMRYEEGKFELTAEDIQNMMRLTEAVVEWAEKKIK